MLCGFGPVLGSVRPDGLLLEDGQVAAPRGVEETQSAAHDVEFEAEGARQARRPVRAERRCNGPVESIHQAGALEDGVEVVAGGVVLPVLADAEALVQQPLAPLVLAPGGPRGDFQYEIRRAAFLPDQPVVPERELRHAHDDEDVGHDGLPRVSLDEVHQHVHADVDVGALGEVVAEPLPGVHRRDRVPVALSHGLAVAAGVLDGDGRCGLFHAQVSGWRTSGDGIRKPYHTAISGGSDPGARRTVTASTHVGQNPG